MIGLRAFVAIGGIAYIGVAAARGDWRASLGTALVCAAGTWLVGSFKEAVWLNADCFTAPGRPIIRMCYEDISVIDSGNPHSMRIMGHARYLFWNLDRLAGFASQIPRGF